MPLACEDLAVLGAARMMRRQNCDKGCFRLTLREADLLNTLTFAAVHYR
jgi:hypothetical protein